MAAMPMEQAMLTAIHSLKNFAAIYNHGGDKMAKEWQLDCSIIIKPGFKGR